MRANDGDRLATARMKGIEDPILRSLIPGIMALSRPEPEKRTRPWGIAQPPKAAFVTRLRPVRLLVQAARQLPDQPTTLWEESPSIGDNASSGRTIGADILSV